MASDPLFPGMSLYSCDFSPVCGLPIPTFVSELYLCMSLLGFPGGSDGKESACNMGDLHSIHGLGRPPVEGKGYPLQYSSLENSMDCIIHGVAQSRTWLSDFHFFHVPFTWLPIGYYLYLQIWKLFSASLRFIIINTFSVNFWCACWRRCTQDLPALPFCPHPG